MTNNTDPVRALPSATVGVEYDPAAIGAAFLAVLGDPAVSWRTMPDVDMFTSRVAEAAALSQQPAAPSGEAVARVNFIGAVASVEWLAPNLVAAVRHGTKLYAAPQQPAAVDEAMSVLTELVATLAATGTVTGGRIYFPERQTRELMKKACDALAAQQQGDAE